MESWKMQTPTGRGSGSNSDIPLLPSSRAVARDLLLGATQMDESRFLDFARNDGVDRRWILGIFRMDRLPYPRISTLNTKRFLGIGRRIACFQSLSQNCRVDRSLTVAAQYVDESATTAPSWSRLSMLMNPRGPLRSRARKQAVIFICHTDS